MSTSFINIYIKNRSTIRALCVHKIYISNWTIHKSFHASVVVTQNNLSSLLTLHIRLGRPSTIHTKDYAAILLTIVTRENIQMVRERTLEMKRARH